MGPIEDSLSSNCACQMYIEYFLANNISAVIRCNNKKYNAQQ